MNIPWLSLCDLSNAFDVISHDILLKKLNIYGIRGNVNNWFRSYLSERKQFVDVDGNSSNNVNMQCGVPQGSILDTINELVQWCCANRLSLNPTKTKYTIIRPLQQQCNITGFCFFSTKKISTFYILFSHICIPFS